MNQFEAYMRILEAFEKEELDYVLVGGFAVIFYGMQRLTRDIDIFIKMVPQNIKKLRKALRSVFNDPSIKEITLSALQKYPVIRYGSPNGLVVDILSRLGDVATYHDIAYKVIDIQGIKIKVATPETLYRLKKDTVRPEDQLDAKFLKEIIKKTKADQTD